MGTEICEAVMLSEKKSFYGNNLFVRGACSAGAERVINHDLKDYRYMSSSLVLSDVGMELRVMGAPAYYPLIESGRNWYESNAYVELILDGTKELVFIVDTMGEAKRNGSQWHCRGCRRDQSGQRDLV